MKKEQKKKKSCFLITPIGATNSSIRYRVDQWIDLIYKPVFEEKYDLIRADKIAAPGIITEQVLDNLINADIAVIDYTELNPNVMYEAAIRHVSKKPFIQIFPHGQKLPFDIQDLRCIEYDPENLQYPELLKEELIKALKEVESKSYKAPEILKHKFDFEQIFKDPERFVELLKKHLPLTSGEWFDKPKGTITAQNPYSYSDSITIGNRIECPNCGTLSSVPSYTGRYFTKSKNEYKCEVCGTHFMA